MSLNTTPRGERVHLALFGRRNVGKSALINALTGQEVSIVSPVGGTTTDPVYKAMELLPLGPVVLIDTPGLDDEGALGALRVERTFEVLKKCDLALLVLEGGVGIGEFEEEVARLAGELRIALLPVFNKSDLQQPDSGELKAAAELCGVEALSLSAVTMSGVDELRQALAHAVPQEQAEAPLVRDLVKPGGVVVLVTPIDEAAPRGRLILPQQQVIRELLESEVTVVVCREHELAASLAALAEQPHLVITDSKVFKQVAAIVPEGVALTSFSILFARYKGDLAALLAGAAAVDKLRDGDRILIAEGCTHHRQSDDIGTVKIPNWLREYSGKELVFEHTSGMRYPDDLGQYALLVHCGACMLNRREMQYRIHQARVAGVPIVNYGVLIAKLQGVVERLGVGGGSC